MSTTLWAIELLSDCVVIVTEDVKNTIIHALEQSLRMDAAKTIEGKDYEGHVFGIRTDSIIVWKSNPEYIKDTLASIHGE